VQKRLRLLFFLLLIGVLLILGLVFQQFVLIGILMPAATVVWLLLRLFVLSIDQRFFWWVLILVPVAVALFRRFREPPARTPALSRSHGLERDRVSSLRHSILLNIHESGDRDTFRRDLAWLFTFLHSSPRQGAAPYQIREAFLERRIPLSESILDFLYFSTLPPAPKPAFVKHPILRLSVALESAGLTIHKQFRRLTGRESSWYLRSIDEVLNVMEKSLSIRKEHDAPEEHRVQ
jgi:hypothetical protein